MEVPLPNKVFNLILQVVTLFCIVFIISMEATIPSLVASSGLCPDRVGGPKKSFVSDLKEKPLSKSNYDCLTGVLATSVLLLAPKMLEDYSVAVEESAWPGPCRVRKFVHVSQEQWRPIGVG
ncbi:hypothetical protein B296_00030349 [Ensete ventricosum]|uniref:Uncharacterized protein n=1 Tax=Ensete ventricosum TaxID=4639 RepID=A0A427A3C2_ENSVE|nr:hypothetical protein B296_00030349 [Ensete ventricosum]